MRLNASGRARIIIRRAEGIWGMRGGGVEMSGWRIDTVRWGRYRATRIRIQVGEGVVGDQARDESVCEWRGGRVQCKEVNECERANVEEQNGQPCEARETQNGTLGRRRRATERGARERLRPTAGTPCTPAVRKRPLPAVFRQGAPAPGSGAYKLQPLLSFRASFSPPKPPPWPAPIHRAPAIIHGGTTRNGAGRVNSDLAGHRRGAVLADEGEDGQGGSHCAITT